MDEVSVVGSTMLNVQINRCKNDFSGVNIFATGNLFLLQPVMDSYIFKDLSNLEYGSLAWLFLKCLSLKESKVFTENLNWPTEGKHTKNDISKSKKEL